MTNDAYITLQLSNLDTAAALGRSLLKSSARLHNVCDTVDKKEVPTSDTSAFFQDSLMYFDFNDAATELSSMPAVLKEFKQKLISIKIENDKMLLDGGYIKEIDTKIQGLFADGSLNPGKTIERNTLDAVSHAVDVLDELKAVLL